MESGSDTSNKALLGHCTLHSTSLHRSCSILHLNMYCCQIFTPVRSPLLSIIVDQNNNICFCLHWISIAGDFDGDSFLSCPLSRTLTICHTTEQLSRPTTFYNVANRRRREHLYFPQFEFDFCGITMSHLIQSSVTCFSLCGISTNDLLCYAIERWCLFPFICFFY